MTHIFLALGANVGNKKEHIEKAIELLSKELTVIVIAPLYESKAVGFTDQDNFVNTAIAGETDLSPKELLFFVKDIEKKIGRIERFHWGPREIDIDILFYGNSIVNEENLIIPHPRLHERDFVLKPLCDLNKAFVHPILRKTTGELYHALPTSTLSVLRQIS